MMQMTIRQKFLKLVYPLFLFFSKSGNKSKTIFNQQKTKPSISFYSLSTQLNNGSLIEFEKLRGKKVLVTNTASDCGYTGQYEALQEIYSRFEKNLVVVGFPSNDFKEQEKGTDEEIAKFCKLNYGVSFPLAKKSVVLKTAEQNPVYAWLTKKELNGWNDKAPVWNFSKYLINEEGILTHYFDPAVSPLDQEMQDAINSND